MPKWIILNKDSNNRSICTIISCFHGVPFSASRGNAIKLSYLLYLASRKAELVQSVLPPCCIWFCQKDQWSLSLLWGRPVSLSLSGDPCLWVALDLEQQESLPLLLGFRIFFKHILNPVLCFSYFLPVRDKGDPIVLLWYYERSSLCSCHRGI